MIDIHRHILPGLDDGPITVEVAVESAKLAEANGIKKIIATPHSNGLNISIETIISSCDRLNRELELRNINLEIIPGAEVRITNNSGYLLRDGGLMTLNNNYRFILLELPNNESLFFISQVLQQIKGLGVIPIIAHPERNFRLMSDSMLLKKLIDIGIYVQINVGSINGFFGTKVANNAKKLIMEGIISFIASDCHGINKRRPDLDLGFNLLKSIIGEKKAYQIVYINPFTIFDENFKINSVSMNKTNLVSKLFGI